MATIAEDRRETAIQKSSLSEWWSEETEYMFQRIDRWVAFVRGYDRLRSQRWSKPDRRRERILQDTPLRFRSHERFDQGLQTEQAKINCCGTFGYQSNDKLDSDCLETYRYDHSIYFKTIGDIRGDRSSGETIGHAENDGVSISSEELVHWNADSLTDFLANEPIATDARNNNRNLNIDANVRDISIERRTGSRVARNAWPIVDLTKLNLNLTTALDSRDDGDEMQREECEENNNIKSLKVESADTKISWHEEDHGKNSSKMDHERTKRFQKIKHSIKNVQKSPRDGNNIACNSVQEQRNINSITCKNRRSTSMFAYGNSTSWRS